MIKTLDKVSIEGTYLKVIKVTYYIPTANNIFNNEMLKAFLIRSGTKQGYQKLRKF